MDEQGVTERCDLNMFNPSHLIRSRHAIYYFRYPVSTQNRVSISLQTRCPKQALYLAKILEYHSMKLKQRLENTPMDHKEIRSIYIDYYKGVLERAKSQIDKDGVLPEANVANLQKVKNDLEVIIQEKHDDTLGHLFNRGIRFIYTFP